MKCVIMSSPRGRAIDHVTNEATAQGAALADFVRRDSRRVLLVISGDLSHMYQYDCTENWYTPSTTSNL